MKTKVDNLLAKLRGLPTSQKTVIGGAAVGAVTIAALSLVFQPDAQYEMFMGGDQEGVPQVIEQLEQGKYDFNVSSNGSVFISSEDRPRANMLLAKLGYESQTSSPYDKLLTNDSMYMSQNKERLFSQQILEENLALSIESIEQVDDAKVNLALADNSGFLKDAEVSKASVVVILKRGERLGHGQVTAIGKLVSSGVKNLSLSNVNIVDQFGNLLSSFDDSGMGSVDQNNIVKTYENAYLRRANEHLYRLYGYDGVTVSSSFDVNFDRVTVTRKAPLTDSVILSHQSENTYDPEGQGGGGVPGAASNQPPGNSDFSARASEDGSDVAGAKTHSNAITNYEVGTEITNRKEQVGKIQGVSVVATIDNAHIGDQDPEQVRADVEAMLRSLSPVPAVTNATVVIKDFAAPEEAEPTDIAFYETPLGKSVIQMGVKGVIAAVLLGMLSLLAAKILRRPKAEEAVKDTDQDAEVVNEPMSAEKYTEDLKSMAESDPESIREAMKSIIHGTDISGEVNA